MTDIMPKGTQATNNLVVAEIAGAHKENQELPDTGKMRMGYTPIVWNQHPKFAAEIDFQDHTIE